MDATARVWVPDPIRYNRKARLVREAPKYQTYSIHITIKWRVQHGGRVLGNTDAQRDSLIVIDGVVERAKRVVFIN
jgi:hypothetical protein